ncbi:calcium-binding protein [Cohaesibacter celericrescens]|uniref:Calcium-binding protein n=1 Tax=Cohaesibacter celericrescens TaxID=2067669 RepID=A0A2N5XV68_9HYPH|nr:calcium-binding protein [Cohaesibacter celericrescens]PLW78370.1 calcium-binding protein [Cohaesibacter celericrescens]
MKKTLIAASIVMAIASPALADEATMIDANEDGNVTLDELQLAYPDITNIEQVFATIDVDADGLISKDELTAAQDSMILPKS